MPMKEHLPLETCYAKNLSAFRSVIMAAQEARFINEQANLGFIKLTESQRPLRLKNSKMIV
jgi:hypothetical protein